MRTFAGSLQCLAGYGLRVLLALLTLGFATAVTPQRLAAQDPLESTLPEVNGWALAPSLPTPRSEQAVTEMDGMIYVIGGYPAGRIPSDLVQVFDVASGRWSVAPDLPFPMHHAMAAGVNGTLYVIGGEFQGA